MKRLLLLLSKSKMLLVAIAMILCSSGHSSFALTAPVVEYNFEDNFLDSSGNNNNGISNGKVTFVAGRAGKAAKFGGVDNPGYVKISNSPSLNSLNAYTITAWVKIDSLRGMDPSGATQANGVHAIISRDQDQGGYAALYGSWASAPNETWIRSTYLMSTAAHATNPNFQLGQWMHLAYVLTQSGMKLYINGNLLSTASATLDLSTIKLKDFYIGQFSNNLYPLDGAIDSLGIYNAELSQQEIQQIIFTPPTLSVSTLSNGAYTNQTPLNITGTVSAPSGIASLTVNGTAVNVSSTGTFSYALPFATEGTTTVTVIATDNSGNSTTDARTIIYDTTLPVLTVSVPADNSQTKDALVTVTGTVSETASVYARIGSGQWQAAQMNGTAFTAQLTLAAGLNTIEITATDLAGNSAVSVKRSVLYDPNSPALAITSPNHDIQINNTAVTVSGTVSDATATTVKLNFNNTDYPQAVTNGQFSQALTFPAEGSYSVTVTATDAVGNPPTTVTRNIIYTPFPGDSNGDGVTTGLVEVLKAYQYTHGLTILTPTEKLRLDCAPLGPDGKPKPNGVIDTADVILLLRKSVGLVSW